MCNLETPIHEETSWLSVLVKRMAHFRTFKGKSQSNTCWCVHAVPMSHSASPWTGQTFPRRLVHSSSSVYPETHLIREKTEIQRGQVTGPRGPNCGVREQGLLYSRTLIVLVNHWGDMRWGGGEEMVLTINGKLWPLIMAML